MINKRSSILHDEQWLYIIIKERVFEENKDCITRRKARILLLLCQTLLTKGSILKRSTLLMIPFSSFTKYFPLSNQTISWIPGIITDLLFIILSGSLKTFTLFNFVVYKSEVSCPSPKFGSEHSPSLLVKVVYKNSSKTKIRRISQPIR